MSKKITRIFVGTAAATCLKMLSALVLSKVIAVKLGPEGLGLIGQLSNSINISLVFATGGLANGIIHLVAAASTKESRRDFVRASFKVFLIISGVISLLLIALSPWLSQFVMKSADYGYIFIILGITVSFFAIHTYFLSFLNGLSDHRNYNLVNGLASVLGLALSVILIWKFGLEGALLALVFNQTTSCLVSFLFVRKYNWYFKSFLSAPLTRNMLLKLSKFSIMGVIATLLPPTTQILVRDAIVNSSGFKNAGLWEAVNRISNLYLTLFFSVMTVYYLPRLSATEPGVETRGEIRSAFKLFAPLAIIAITTIFSLKTVLIDVLLSREFDAIKPLFLPQLIGDFFRILAYIYAYLLIARSRTGAYIAMEIFASLILLSGALVSLSNWGLYGVVSSYAFTYISYFVVLHFIAKKIA